MIPRKPCSRVKARWSWKPKFSVCTEAEVNSTSTLTRSAADIVEFTASQAASGAHIGFRRLRRRRTLNHALCGLVGYPNAELA